MHSTRHGHAHVVQLIGELDMNTSKAFEHELKRVEATAVREIIVDLSSLTFIGADGLKVLIQANARSRGGGKQLVLVRGPEQVQATFETTGLLSQMPFADYGQLRSLLHSHRPPMCMAA
jgi:anti-anti-sigma factor